MCIFYEKVKKFLNKTIVFGLITLAFYLISILIPEYSLNNNTRIHGLIYYTTTYKHDNNVNEIIHNTTKLTTNCLNL